MAIKLLTLSPHGSFFFGSEVSFGQGQNQNYYVRSMLFPQQTTVLGMLRFELLKSDPEVFDPVTKKVRKKSKADAAIGESSFHEGREGGYGLLNCLSPVFLTNPKGVPYLLSAASRLEDSARSSLEVDKQNGFVARNLLSGTENKQAILLKNDKGLPHDGKLEFAAELLGADGTTLPLLYDGNEAPEGVFILQNQIGNQKQYDGETDESGFYKQDRYKLQTGWKFAVLADFNAELPMAFETSRHVQLGAERGMFLLETQTPKGKHFANISSDGNAFSGFETLYGQEYPKSKTLGGLALLSDCWLDSQLKPEPEFAMSKTVSFRHLNNTHLRDPNELWTANSAPKSLRYNMFQRGSVFFSANPSKHQDQIQSLESFRRIGYNYCITFEKNQK